jgi:hypothetical protein
MCYHGNARTSLLSIPVDLQKILHYCQQYKCTRRSCPIVTKLEFRKFHENPSARNRVATCKQTDRQDEDNRRFRYISEGA